MELRTIQLNQLARETWRAAVERFPRRDLERVEGFLDIVRGATLAPEVDPDRAINAHMYFPGLVARPWWSAEDFDVCERIASRFALIRQEAMRLLGRPRVFEAHPGVVSVGSGDSGNGSPLRGMWLGYYLHRHFSPVRTAAAETPVTARSLDGAPLGREAMLSFLSPRSEIGVHSDCINFVLSVYLPLFSEPGAWIRFGSETRTWQEGVCYAADSTYYHTSVNASSAWRGLLIVDLWHPDLTEVERSVLADAAPRIDRIIRAA